MSINKQSKHQHTKKTRRCLGLLLVAGLCFFHMLFATTSSLIQTQSKLKQLDIKINRLQHSLASAQDKQGLLNQELSNTEKQMGDGVKKLHLIQKDMTEKEHRIAGLQEKINQLNQQLSTQQHLLASHVRARYQTGEYQPLKWLINQESPYKISRILTYYQYIIKTRQQLIIQIDETKATISKNKDQLHQQLLENQQLKLQLTQHQQQLEQDKKYHTTLIQSLNHDIQDHQQTLSDVQKDKENLTQLLHALLKQSAVQSSRPFLNMRKKLPLPVQTAHHSMQRMNQGLTFFADEGTTVTAVYPGKVVFSDWLKGYGLLLIIDHGQGFMTLYAHNQSLFKRTGQTVLQNEQIAKVGHSGGIKQNGLYFEIRRRGKAISPLDWLS